MTRTLALALRHSFKQLLMDNHGRHPSPCHLFVWLDSGQPCCWFAGACKLNAMPLCLASKFEQNPAIAGCNRSIIRQYILGITKLLRLLVKLASNDPMSLSGAAWEVPTCAVLAEIERKRLENELLSEEAQSQGLKEAKEAQREKKKKKAARKKEQVLLINQPSQNVHKKQNYNSFSGA